MKSENVIEVQNVYRNFKVYLDKSHELKEKVLFRKRNRYELREVLKGISFEVKKGEAVALIGKNGCGKSTTLKLLNRIIYPDSGEIKINGRISSLLELGAGFHPDMSGRENIYINASIFGLTHAEISKRLNEIITFSELEDFIDNPVRTYSSGMYMRLAFSVAINVDADILLIDEILGVGDASFQKKCFAKLQEIKNSGTTIVVVSHSMQQLQEICDRFIWIDNGEIREIGMPDVVSEHYKEVMERNRELRDMKESQMVTDEEMERLVRSSVCPPFCCNKAFRYGNQEMEISDFRVKNREGIECNTFTNKDAIIVDFEIDTKNETGKVNVAFRLTREDGILCFASDYATLMSSRNPDDWDFINTKDAKTGEIVIELGERVMPGKYYLDIVVTKEGVEVYDEISHISDIYIEGKTFGIGMVELNTSWKFGE